MPDEETLREAADELVAAPSDDADVEVEREQGAPAIEELDAETRARRDAALRHVRKFGDPALRASAVPIDRFDAALKREIEMMTELMHDALGVGLAATQLGILHRVLVYRAYPEDPVTALVNPVLEWTSEETEGARRPSGGEPDGGANGAQAEHEARPAVSSAKAGPAGSG